MVRFALRRRSVSAVRRNGLSAFLSGAAADERKAAVNGPDPLVSVAIALGWHTAGAAGRDSSETRQTIPTTKPNRSSAVPPHGRWRFRR